MNTTQKFQTAMRLALGLIFFVFGLNGFLNFIPAPPHEGASAAFLGGLAQAGYFFPLLKGAEVLVGLALLTGRWVPLSLVVLAPITLNIVAFHLFLESAGLGLSFLVLGLHLALAWTYRDVFAPLLRARDGEREVSTPLVARSHDPVSVGG